MRRSDFTGEDNKLLRKANLVLNLILLALILIGVRVWYLSIIQYDEKFEESKKPQRKTRIELATRATVRDRFNEPLAINRAAYKAAVVYSPIRQIPTSQWEIDQEGKKKKVHKRKQYIRELSLLLGKELDLDPERVEDLIYSKAALYFNLPYILKDEIEEKSYYRLKMLEKDWPGLRVERYSKREYPGGKTACDLIGYMGAISREEYEENIREKNGLEAYLIQWENGEDPPLPQGYNSPLEVRKRFKDLQDMAYTAQDFVGKMGVEALFEEDLRGFQGKKNYYADSKGNFLKELPGTMEAIPGKRVLLTISKELQEYAEKLLAQNEDVRTAKISGHGKATNKKQPWIKGGAILAMDPNTGEILTLASYPRYDPNDFIVTSQNENARQKRSHINRWFENENYIGEIWNQQIPLERERFDSETDQFYEEKKWLHWSDYLSFMLPEGHPILEWFSKHGTIENVHAILEAIDILEASGFETKEWIRSPSPLEGENISFLSKVLDHFPTPYTKLLFIDLCQVAVYHTAFSNELLRHVGKQTLEMHRDAAAAFAILQDTTRQIAKELFHSLIFKRWREQNEKIFLKQKREIEKQKKSYPKPYLDYLDEKERELFALFWEKTRLDLSLILLNGSDERTAKLGPFKNHLEQLHVELEQGAHVALPLKGAYETLKKATGTLKNPFKKSYLATLRSFQELNRPLKGKYKRLRNRSGKALEKHLAAAFYPMYGFGYGRSHAYRQATTQGSIFKLITSYETLMQMNRDTLKKGKGLKTTNPLDVIDRVFKVDNQTYVGYTASGKPIPQLYKGGRIPRSHLTHMGKMDLLHAIENSSNLYFSLMAGDILESPEDLAIAAKKFGFGSKTGIDLPGEIAGRVPTDLLTNRTGLYAMAIGQHSLVVTPLQTAVMLGALANRGDLLKPQIIKALASSGPKRGIEWGETEADLKQKKLLSALGIDFPIFENRVSGEKKGVEKRARRVNSHIEMPSSLRNLLLEGMRRVVLRTHAESLGTLSKLYSEYPEAISDYIDLKNKIIGKTSTSESMERIDFDEFEGTNLYTHVWFGGLAFENGITSSFERPDLVVVVYLRFGAYGKEAAPLAAQIVQKWHEIKARIKP